MMNFSEVFGLSLSLLLWFHFLSSLLSEILDDCVVEKSVYNAVEQKHVDGEIF